MLVDNHQKIEANRHLLDHNSSKYRPPSDRYPRYSFYVLRVAVLLKDGWSKRYDKRPIADLSAAL